MVLLNQEIIGYINVFEKTTRAGVKDCFLEDDSLIFVIQQGQIMKALGPNGINLRKLGSLFKKNIKVIGFHSDPTKFISNLIYPVRSKEIVLEDNMIVIRTNNVKEKGQVFGRDKSNLRRMQKLVSKYFPDLSVKVE
jgi:N utilization substance protein A